MTSDPDQIRSSIEQTQQHLSADVDALAEKVSPPRIMERRVQQTRSAMTNFKDAIMGNTADATSAIGGTASSVAGSAKDVAGSAKDVAGSAKDVAGSAKDTMAAKASSAGGMAGSVPEQARQRARGNPLAAGLIAFGAGWLLSSLLPATEREQQAAAELKDLAAEKGGPVKEQLSQAGQEATQSLRESAQQRAQSVKETATGAASTVAGEAQSQSSDLTSHAQEARSRVAEQASPNGS
jgi:cell division septum initiation protein DivIVA